MVRNWIWRWRAPGSPKASSNPNVGIIECEPYINGVAMVFGKIRTSKVNNILVHPGDARGMMDVLPKESVSRAFLLYPDPWSNKELSFVFILVSEKYNAEVNVMIIIVTHPVQTSNRPD